MTDDYGDPETDPEVRMADAALRDFLSDVPADAVTDVEQVSMMIEVAIATAWPDGRPPTVDELTQDPDFDAVTAIDAMPADADEDAVSGSGDADYDAADYDAYDAADYDDGADWDVPGGSDE